jgi:hypothetical protein
LTGSYYFFLSARHSFLFDDWAMAVRSASILEPYNGHLSIVPIAVNQALLSTFGLVDPAPYYVLGISCLLLLATAVYLLVRQRIGEAPALVAAVIVLWAPAMNIAPALYFSFHLALVASVACAAAMPIASRRADVAIGVALGAAFATSGVSVAIAAACAVHAVLTGFRPGRWVAVAVPSLAWFVWWRLMGSGGAAIGDAGTLARGVLDGVLVTLGSYLGGSALLGGGVLLAGAVLAAGWLTLLAARVRTDRASVATQVAWGVGLVVWWAGLILSRGDATDSPNTARYAYAGLVLILLSLLPASPRPLRSPRGLRVRWALVSAVAVSALIVLANHASILVAAGNRDELSIRVARVMIELDAQPADPAMRLPPEMSNITVEQYRTAVARYGSPLRAMGSPDAELVARRAVGTQITGPSPGLSPPCPAAVSLVSGQEAMLYTDAEPATLRARRFGPEFVDVRTLPPYRTVRVWVSGPSVVDRPWSLYAPGACLHRE